MEKYIIDRVLEEAGYIIKNGSTVRDIANIYNISKSTVHKDLHERLKNVDFLLYEEVDKIFKEHIQTRHIKGGESTKRKYLKL